MAQQNDLKNSGAENQCVTDFEPAYMAENAGWMLKTG
jgi:hypothetical protein